MGAIPPSAILSRKGIAGYGGLSRTGPLRTRDFCSEVVASPLAATVVTAILCRDSRELREFRESRDPSIGAAIRPHL